MINKKLLCVLSLMLIFLIGCQKSINCTKIQDAKSRLQCQEVIKQCENTDNKEPNSMCEYSKQLIALKIAKESKDSKECEQIYNLYKRNECYATIAYLKSDIKICDKISNDTFKQRCLYDIPITLNPITIEEIPAKYKPNNIVREYSLYPKTELVQKTTQFGQGTYSAYSTQDEYHFSALQPEECDKLKNAKTAIQDSNPYEGCITQLAEIMGDYTICKLLSVNPDHISFCLVVFATQRGDARACFLINGKPMSSGIPKFFSFKEECLNDAILSHPSKEGCGLLSNS